MKIAIIGAGFTGLSAAYRLLKNGHKVKIFEKDSSPGGLAVGYKEKKWKWTIEKHYHHLFTNDKNIINFAKEINFKIITKTPNTSVFVDDDIYRLDSPKYVMNFPKLSLEEKIRMSAVLGALKSNPFWKPLEKFKASKVLPMLMGGESYNMLWDPLLTNKFGRYSNEISLAWFWARIYKRTQSLAYPEGGFLTFAEKISDAVKSLEGEVSYGCLVKKITNQKNKISIEYSDKDSAAANELFDSAIITLPSQITINLLPDLPYYYKKNLLSLKSLGAINLVIRLNKPFFSSDTYWLSMCDKKSPIMAIVEHTNFMDKTHYDNENIIYVGNYLEKDHKYFSLSEEALVREYDDYLKKINHNYKKNIIGMKAFKSAYAQPIIPINYSSKIPSFVTPLKNIFIANIDQVYPWDRGTNYAVELGEKIAELIK